MTNFLYLIWNADPDIFTLFTRPIRWYGLLFALGFLVGQQVILWMLKKEAPEGESFKKRAEKDVETLTIYLVLATIIGARLGHVLFYEPDKYFKNPLDIIKIWEGGLASHGAAIAILFALWLFARKRANWTWLQIVDRIVIVVALVGALIRFGNFTNSEIYGLPTGSEFGIVFTRNATEAIVRDSGPVKDISYSKMPKEEEGNYVPIVINLTFKRGIDENQKKAFIENNLATMLGGRYSYISEHLLIDPEKPVAYTINGREAQVNALGIPRHPTQLYESLTTFLIFLLLLSIWYRYKANTPHGRLFGLFLVILFGLRFVHEYLKENQVSFEDNIPLNMGQWLSIPMVILGILILIHSYRHQGTGSKPLPPQG